MEILKKYENNGTFVFKKGEKLSSKCNDIPNQPGVYLIYTIKKEKIDLVYIGASGKVNQDGSFKIQKLKNRIQNMQNSTTRRETFFENKIAELNLDRIKVDWYVTYGDVHRDLPLNIEGTLLQIYYDKNGVLPLWNNQA